MTTIQAQDPIWRRTTAEIHRARSVAWAFARRDVQLRFAQTRMGWLWSLGQPLLAAAIVLIVFSWIVQVQAPNGFSYPLYAFAALPAWLMAQHIILQGAPSLVHNQHIVSKVAFPRQALPMSKAGVALVDFMVASLLFVVFRGYTLGVWLDGLHWVLLSSLVSIYAALGIAYWIAALSVRYRDILALLPFLLQGLFLLTPIAYPTERFASALGAYSWILYLNPFVCIADGMRYAWLGVDDLNNYHLISFLMATGLFITGTWALKGAERNMIDHL
jgi:lipopolysaccharide transport system permease protein